MTFIRLERFNASYTKSVLENKSKIKLYKENSAFSSIDEGKKKLVKNIFKSPYDNKSGILSTENYEGSNFVIPGGETHLGEKFIVNVGQSPDKIDVLNDNNINVDLEKNIDKEIKLITPTLFPYENTERINDKDLSTNYYQKKDIVKSIYKKVKGKNYKDQINLHWAFSNYNTVNLFTIGSSNNVAMLNAVNNNITGKTHKTCLIYPNVNSKYSPLSKSFSFSCYINPRRHQIKGYHYNPGCIAYLPYAFAIYIIPGSEKDFDDSFRFTSKFRLAIKLHSSANSSLGNAVITQDIAAWLDKSNFYFDNNLDTFITKDNILSLNSWHHINVDYRESNLRIIVDGEVIHNIFLNKNDEYNFNDSRNLSSLLLIGNKFSSTPDGRYKNYYFDPDQNVKYHLNYNTETRNIPEFNDFDFYDTLIQINSNNHTNVSNALNCEIHDIRLYNTSIPEQVAKEQSTKGISNISEEKTDFGLSFYVPVYYIPREIRKEAFIGTRIKRQVKYNFINNPYFENHVGGLEVSVENFVIDLAQNYIPFITGVHHDDYNNLSNNKSLSYITGPDDENFNSWNEYERLIAKGATADFLIKTKFTKNAGKSKAELQDNLIYRNYFILPNDNGIQQQDFAIINEFDSTFKNENFLGIDNFYMPEHVNLEAEINSENAKNLNFAKESSDIIGLKLLTRISLGDKQDVSLSGLYPWARCNDSFLDDILGSINDLNEIGFVQINIPDINNLFNTSDDFGTKANPINMKIDDIEFDDDRFETYFTENVNSFGVVEYLKYCLPKSNIISEYKEKFTKVISIPRHYFSNRIKENSFEALDKDLFGTYGALSAKVKDRKGMIYRAECNTKVADWNFIGHILYREGLVTVLHPAYNSIFEVAREFSFTGIHNLYTTQVMVPLKEGFAFSKNKTHKLDNFLSEEFFDQDERFVLISSMNIHDEDLNIVAKANFAKPVVKRESDNMLFKVRLDF